MLLISLVIVGIICVCIFLWKFLGLEIVVVSGNSMNPTMKEGQPVLVRHRLTFPYDLHLGEIYCYQNPQGVPVIKRLRIAHQVENFCMLWFEGDNKDFSTDSRHYGHINASRVESKVIYFRGMFKHRRKLAIKGGIKIENIKSSKHK